MQLMRLLVGFALWLVLSAGRVCAQSSDLAIKSNRGKELIAAGKFEEAIPIYKDLVRTLPGNPGPVMNLGLALHMTGHDQEAVTQFQTVLKLQPNHLPAHLFLGAAYLGLKEPAKAIEPLETFVRAQPNDREARLLLGEALLSFDRFEEAAKQFGRLSVLDPENPKAWNGLGLSYEGLANRNFEELEKVAPGSAYWLVADQYPRAFYFYREALKQMPALRGVHAAVAEVYRKTGHPDWAAQEEQQERSAPPQTCSDMASAKGLGATGNDRTAVPRTDPRVRSQRLECDFRGAQYHELLAGSKGVRTPEAYFWRTRVYNELARQAFRQLAQLPPSGEVHELLAKIHFGQRNYPAAARDWQEALKFSPESPYYQRELAVSLSASGDYEHARPLLSDLTKRSPDSVELNYWLGFTLLSLEKAEEAIPFLRKAVKGDPGVLESQRDLARAYLRVGLVEEAVPHLRAALPIDEDGGLYYQLAQAYRRTGQRNLEKEALVKFHAIQSSTTVEKKRTEEQIQITPP
ncbi:MAG: hypothetical protein DMG26_00095 [Acidobacteria bacterium]|nr:MAG: hypothetical protein DMG26_00095 [Acidobacteriota bacterium]